MFLSGTTWVVCSMTFFFSGESSVLLQKNLIKMALSIGILSSSFTVYAADVTATIHEITCSKGTGVCSVFVNAGLPLATACGNNSVLYWKIAEPMGNQFLSMLLAAQASGKQVLLSTTSGACVDGGMPLDLVRVK